MSEPGTSQEWCACWGKSYVKDQLGHSSIKMTVDVCGHLVPGAKRQAVNRLPTVNSPIKVEREQTREETAEAADILFFFPKIRTHRPQTQKI